MLTNWFSQPAGSARSPTEDGNDDDTQVMEPDQGNGEMSPSPLQGLEPHGVALSQRPRRLRQTVAGQQLTGRLLQFSLTSSRNYGLAPTSVVSSCPPSF